MITDILNTVTIVHSHDDILKAVKQESSLFALQRANDENKLFDTLILDEDNDILFRRLFFDAQINVTTACMAYIRIDVPTYNELQDFSKSRDFVLQLTMPPTFSNQIIPALGIKIKEHLIAYIMYRWLETKQQEAPIFKERADMALYEVKKYVGMRNKPLSRQPKWF